MITESVQQVLTTLYPLYKEEVYRRREQMMKWTAVGAVGFLAMLGGLLLSPQKTVLSPLEGWLLALASLGWSGLCGALVLQQQHRHRQAKQVLIQLEQALGFYEEGLLVENQMLYPERWKSDWLSDRSSMVYLSALAFFNLLVLLALLIV